MFTSGLAPGIIGCHRLRALSLCRRIVQRVEKAIFVLVEYFSYRATPLLPLFTPNDLAKYFETTYLLKCKLSSS